ncbi:helix-turn-helix domain-containing protein [Epilithonimonas hispanica]|uniref:Helix-turn-helix domain-containing protein n=1 Tax=Epilithonimonas hispanica TaxID=358687 RepID=A0A3D9CVX3_9FLAO|nr:helix-turn-helix domain-containing protein [Epilithonimonas hispanica]REC69831.1 hypothetical protein DRF58_11680 [Epilithonimonas hispanica]
MKNPKKNLSSYVELFFEMLAEVIILLRQLADQKVEAEKSYDSADVKILLKISDSTFYRWCKQGKLHSKKVGGKIYVSKASVDNLLK